MAVSSAFIRAARIRAMSAKIAGLNILRTNDWYA
jgi:hypothetical protein